MIAHPVRAQETPPQAAPEAPAAPPQLPAAAGDRPAGPAGDIVVTGSRVARSTFDTPNPVTVLGQDRLQELAITNVGQLVNDLPQFRGTTTPITQGPSNFNVGAQEADLRGLGAGRTLVLVDSLRFVGNPNTFYGTQAVDLNMIPAIAIDRTEVATGGASAQYGSDAVGGVVNLLLNKRLEGFRANADYGISDRNDNRSWTGSAILGRSLFGGAGHVVIAGEYSKAKGVGNCYEREYCADTEALYYTNTYLPTAGSIVPGSGLAVGGGNPASRNYVPGLAFRSVQYHVYSDVVSYGGLIATGALAGNEFMPDGSIRPFQYGSPRNGSQMVGGGGLYTLQYSRLRVPTERYTFYSHFDYDITSTINFSVDANLGFTRGMTTTIPPQNTGGTATSTTGVFGSTPIRADNAFLQGTGAASLYNPNSSAVVFNFNRYSNDLGNETGNTKSRTGRIAAMLKGSLGTFHWDLDYAFSLNRSDDALKNDRIVPNYNRALDAIVDRETVITPATGGIVCRSTLDPNPAVRAAAAGCVPINLFGTNRFDPAARDYIFGYGTPLSFASSLNISKLQVFNANLRGNLFNTWAGPVAVAVGGEAREISIDHSADVGSIQTQSQPTNPYWTQSYGLPFSGKQKVIEGYVEANIPVAKDLFFAKSADINAAARLSHDNYSGSVTSWKVGLDWAINSSVRLRATKSKDIRAPNTTELFLPGASTINAAGFVNPFTGQTDTNVITQSGGAVTSGQTLKPENADTITLGVILQPQWNWARGFRASVDYYDIKIKNAIRTLAAQNVLDYCFQGADELCSRFQRNAAGQVTFIFTGSSNFAGIEQEGFDVEGSYRADLANMWDKLGGNLNIRVIANIAEKLTTTLSPKIAPVNRVGQTGGLGQLAGGGGSGDVPDYNINSTITYTNGPLSLTSQVRYIPKGKVDVTYIGPDDDRYASIVANPSNPLYTSTIANNRVPSRTYVNVGARYRIVQNGDQQIELFGQVNNLFDRKPPITPFGNTVTNATLFDVIGRDYRAGIRVRY